MRGFPNNPVICTGCGKKEGFPRNGLCRTCRGPSIRKKYFWTPDLDDRLRRIYAEHSHNYRALGPAITSLAKLMHCPRYIVFNRAGQLRIRVSRAKRWTRAEVQFLREHAGVSSLDFIMKTLKRGYVSVTSKIEELQLSRRVTEGYSRADLAEVLSVSAKLISKWISRGWMRPLPDTDRIPEEQVRKFIRTHPEQYSLKRVDEAWFKGMLFPKFGNHAHGMGENVSYNPYREVA
jgi:hypothetical protein